MRFRFCGDLDCPDWILAEISILSKISSVKMKLFGQQIMNQLLNNEIDYAKIYKFTSDAKFEMNDIKAAIACVDFIFTSGCKYNVDGDTLSNELQQLGLPKELSIALCKVYDTKFDDLHYCLYNKSMRLSRLKSIEWRVDYVLASSISNEINEPEIQIKICKQKMIDNNTLKDEENDADDDTLYFTSTGEKFRILLTELKDVYKQMDDIS